MAATQYPTSHPAVQTHNKSSGQSNKKTSSRIEKYSTQNRQPRKKNLLTLPLELRRNIYAFTCPVVAIYFPGISDTLFVLGGRQRQNLAKATPRIAAELHDLEYKGNLLIVRAQRGINLADIENTMPQGYKLDMVKTLYLTLDGYHLQDLRAGEAHDSGDSHRLQRSLGMTGGEIMQKMPRLEHLQFDGTMSNLAAEHLESVGKETDRAHLGRSVEVAREEGGVVMNIREVR